MKIVEMSNQLCIENDDKLKKMEDGIIQSQESNKMFLDDLELSGTARIWFRLSSTCQLNWNLSVGFVWTNN